MAGRIETRQNNGTKSYLAGPSTSEDFIGISYSLEDYDILKEIYDNNKTLKKLLAPLDLSERSLLLFWTAADGKASVVAKQFKMYPGRVTVAIHRIINKLNIDKEKLNELKNALFDTL